MACDNCIDLDVVRFLVEQCPEVLESSGTETPLHTLCVNLTSPRVIASYARNLFHTLAVSKKAVETRDSQGRTALHLLVEQNAPREFVEFVMECSPDVAQVKDAAGQTPLHVAIRGCAAATGSNVPVHEDMMRCLLGAYPLAVNTVDNNGMTPLMLACERDAPLSVIYRLVRVDPFCNHSLDWSQVSLPGDRAGEPISYWRRTLSAVKGLLF